VTIQITTTHDIYLNGRLSHFLLTRASERKRFYFHLPYERKSFDTQEKQTRRLNKLCLENTSSRRPLHALLNGPPAAAVCLSGALIARGLDGANAALLLTAPGQQVPACCESLRRDRWAGRQGLGRWTDRTGRNSWAERRDEKARSLYGLGCVGKVSLAVPMTLGCVSRMFRDGDFVW
jgi:hypothetical protein